MGQSVDVVVSELHSASARLADAAQQLQDGLASVDTETTQLLGSGWRGQAAAAYGPAWQQWHDGAEQVVKGMQRMSELLTIAGKEYAKTDEQAAGAIGSSMQGSGGAGGGAPSGGTGSHGATPSAAGQPAASGAGNIAQQMNLGQAMSPVAQLAGQLTGQVAQALTQGGQALAGLAQEAEQIASGLAEQTGETKSSEQDAPASAAPPSDPTPRSR